MTISRNSLHSGLISVPLPRTLNGFTRHLGNRLKERQPFMFRQTGNNPENPATLHKLDLIDVTVHGSTHAILQFDGSFKGPVPPSLVECSKDLMTMLGAAQLSLGMGAFNHANKTTVKGVAVQLNRCAIPEELWNELAQRYPSKQPVTRIKRLPVEVTQKTRQQRELTAQVQQVNKEMADLLATRNALQGQLARLTRTVRRKEV
ncbi:MAG: hypothetical protein Q7S87_01430 [Agitococcus sp.]|nr:hypothetical protein [Agitococcus sp.]MDO9177116.1 hypothetical protein [Agitococcus sp.]